jgi:hypothetical protein
MSFSKRANMARKRYATLQRRIDRFVSIGAGIVLFAVFAYIIISLGRSAGLW